MFFFGFFSTSVLLFVLRVKAKRQNVAFMLQSKSFLSKVIAYKSRSEQILLNIGNLIIWLLLGQLGS